MTVALRSSGSVTRADQKARIFLGTSPRLNELTHNVLASKSIYSLQRMYNIYSICDRRERQPYVTLEMVDNDESPI